MQPEIFQTKYFTLYTLWVFIVIGLFIGTYSLIKLSIRKGLKIQFLSEHSWKIILWALIGARLMAVILNLSTYFYEISFKTIIQLLYIWDKGLSLTGAFIALLICVYLLCKKHEQNFFKWLDVIIPSIILALSISHIGAFFEGINYGKPTSLPWGVNFESPQIKYTVPIHPTQIYAFLYSLAVGWGLVLLDKTEKVSKIEKPGFIGILGVGAFSFIYFFEQFIRGDDTLTVLGIRIPQILAFLITISSGIFLFLRYNKRTILKKH